MATDIVSKPCGNVPALKSFCSAALFVAVFVDILARYLTKWDPVYAYTVVGAGALLGLALAVQILVSLWQMWFWRPKKIT